MDLRRGFTLIELLVVIGILAVLLTIVLIAINPARQFAQANNTKRRSDVVTVLNAIHQYLADSRGLLPPGMPAQGASASITSAAGGTGVTFCSTLVPRYVAQLPADPQAGTFASCSSYDSRYVASVSSALAGDTPRVTVSAPQAELGEVISVTR